MAYSSKFTKSVLSGEYKGTTTETKKKKKSSYIDDVLSGSYESGYEGIKLTESDYAPVKSDSSSLDDLRKKEKELRTQIANYDRKKNEDYWWDKDKNVIQNILRLPKQAFRSDWQEEMYADDPEYDALVKEYQKTVKATEDKYVAEKEYEDGFMGSIDKVTDTITGNVMTSAKGVESTAKKILGQTPTEEEIAPTYYEKLSQKARQETDGAGGVALDVIGSASRMLPQLMIGNPIGATAMGFANYGGGAYNQARQEGYSEEQATLYGSIIGGSEILLGKVLGAFEDTAGAGGLSNKIMNRLIKNEAIKKYISGAVGEFSEEYLQEFLEPIIRNTVLEEENGADFWNTMKDDLGEGIKQLGTQLFNTQNLKAGAMGALTAGVMGVPSTIDAYNYVKNTGRSLETGLTANEQSIVDKEVENRVKTLEENGKKVTNRQKAKIEEQVRNEFVKGELSTDTATEEAPVVDPIQSINTEQTVEEIDNQIMTLEEQLSKTENDAEYERISNEIRVLEERANQLEQQEVAPTVTQQNSLNTQLNEQNVQLNNEIAPVQAQNTQEIVPTQKTDGEKGNTKPSLLSVLSKPNAYQTKSLRNPFNRLTPTSTEEVNGTKYEEYNFGRKFSNMTFGQKYFDTEVNEAVNRYVNRGEQKIEDSEFAKEAAEMKKVSIPAPFDMVLYRGGTSTDGAMNRVAISSTFDYETAHTYAVRENPDNYQIQKIYVKKGTPIVSTYNAKDSVKGEQYAHEYWDKSGEIVLFPDSYNIQEISDGVYEVNGKSDATQTQEVVNTIETEQASEAIAPLRQELSDLTSELKSTIKDTKKEIKSLKKEIKGVKTEIKDIYDEGKINTEADLPILHQKGSESFKTIDDKDYTPIAEDTMPEYEPSTMESPLEAEGRDIDSVGNRKVKAYQYENPEVRPYFQAEARVMLGDLKNSVKGERGYNDQVYYDTAGEQGFYGTKRQTTDDIAYLLDNFKYTYAEIEKGLNAIIEDHGAENIAVAKRIEFMLDERLREGYTSIDGTEIPANQKYINLLQGMEQAKQYSEAPLGEAPTEITEEIPYTDSASKTEATEEIAPVRKEVEWNSVEDTSKGKQQHINLNNLGETLQNNNVDWDSVESTSLDDAKQLTIDGTEEDLVTKTKKELRKALLGTEVQKEFITSALDNAKNRSMALMNNTDTIRNTELVFGRDAGKVINDVIFQKEIDNEADSIKWQNDERKDIKELGIKARSKESAAVQKYGEKQWVNDAGEVLAYGDAELASEFSDVETQEKIKNAAKAIRSKYDNYIDRANEVLTKLGFEPIKKRNDYMRHFQELNDVFSRHGIPFNAQNMQEHVLPTDINGLTEFWSPQKNYFANMQARKGMKTTYDAITGIDGYIGGIANLIYHTEDIQRGRAFEELIRETYGEDKGWDNLENLPDELKRLRTEKIQDNHLSNYAAWVHEWTNNVAGKKNKIDRSVESVFGRKAFSFLDETRKQVGANMIGFNLSSSLTNLIAPVQAMAKTNKLAVVKGTADTIKNMFVKDNFMDNNKFLTSRMGTDMISKNAWQKMQNAGFVFMKGMDWFSSNQIVRSKYYELRAKGMSEQQAHKEAGQFAARILGDRTKGANAQIYNSKLLGLVTQFQLEVNNQLYSTFYDTYQESKENAQGNALKTAAGMTFTLGQLFAFTHLFGQTFEAIAGYNPTFDVIEILKTAFGWGDDDDDEEKTTSERLKEAADKLVDSLPYVNILTGGGRIPVASGIPNLVGVATGGKDEYGNELTLEDELKKLIYLIPPTGGNQVKKTTQGLSMFDEDLPVKGSYTDSGNLRFPVEDTPLNRLQAALFGQWSNENAREYFDKKRQPLKEKQIQEYAELDLPIKDYWEYRDGLADKKTAEEKFDYIDSLDVTTEQKNIMINNAMNTKTTDENGYQIYKDSNNKNYYYDEENNILYDSKDNEVSLSKLYDLTKYTGKDMRNYGDFSNYEEFDYAVKYPDKYRVIEQIDTFENYSNYKEQIAKIQSQYSADEGLTSKQKTALSKQRKAAVQQYIESLPLDVPQKIMLEKMAGGYSIKSYKSYMQSYIESLPLTAEEKQAIDDELFK